MTTKKAGRKTNASKGQELAVTKSIKFTPAEWFVIKGEAWIAGMSVSKYIRTKLMEGKEVKIRNDVPQERKDIIEDHGRKAYNDMKKAGKINTEHEPEKVYEYMVKPKYTLAELAARNAERERIYEEQQAAEKAARAQRK